MLGNALGFSEKRKHDHLFRHYFLILLPLSQIVSCLWSGLVLALRARAVTLDEDHSNHDEDRTQPPFIAEVIPKHELSEQRGHEEVCGRRNNGGQEAAGEQLEGPVEELPDQKVAADHQHNALNKDQKNIKFSNPLRLCTSDIEEINRPKMAMLQSIVIIIGNDLLG